MSNMNTLRQNIFDTMEGLRKGRIPVQTAKAQGELAQVLINSLKVEIDARKAVGNKQLVGFVRETQPEDLSPEEREIAAKELNDLLPPAHIASIGGVVTIHRMKGDEE